MIDAHCFFLFFDEISYFTIQFVEMHAKILTLCAKCFIDSGSGGLPYGQIGTLPRALEIWGAECRLARLISIEYFPLTHKM